MFNIGDKVKFINWEDGNHTPSYFTESDDIPEKLIIHGYSIQKDSNNGGIVEGIHNNYIIVSFLDKENNKTQLGFLESSLLLIKSSTDYEIY